MSGLASMGLIPMSEEPTPNYTLAAIKAQAEEIVRAWGAPGSQESEVMAAASVGRAGHALAHLVLHWFRQQEHEAATAQPQVLIRGTMPDWLMERLRSGELEGYAVKPETPDA